MIKCISHKKVYQSLELAEEALIEARTRFNYAPNQGPVAVYRCEDCGYYHLTSQGTMNPKLAEHLTSGKIQLQKEADRWIAKLKNK